ncbi:MAG: PRC-barrel domain-containing protein [Methanobacteriaceae archaeon]
MDFMEDLSGKEAIDNAGNIIGIVNDIEINKDLKRIESIILKESNLSSKLGFGKKKIISINKIKAIGDKIFIDDIFNTHSKNNNKLLIKIK